MRSLFCVLVLFGLAAGAPAPKKTAQPPRLPASAARWMRPLTLQQRIAQLVFVPFVGAAPNSRSAEYRRFVRLVRDLRVGGLILVNWHNGRVVERAEPYELAAFVNRMQRLARVPLLVSGDFERGASMRVSGTAIFPHAMAFAATGDPALTRRQGAITARESRALGVHWAFYPVADVNNNPDNPIINIRSFGEDPRTVAAHVEAFIEGAHADRARYVLTTAKHFPGHGDTSVDTHLNMATITADRARLETVELAPFRAAIAAGVDAIMTAHIAVPAMAPPGVPATLSPEILTGLLRRDMGFRGVVVTDALEMGGVAKVYSTGEAAVRAIEAGADVLLMPPDPEAAIRAVAAAVRFGRIPRRRIDESLSRVLAAKARVGLDRRRAVNLEAIEDEIDSPEANELAREVAGRALTLVRNEGGLVPLAAPERACYVILPESEHSTSGAAFAREVRRRAGAAARIFSLKPSLAGPQIEEAARQATACDAVVVAAFATVSAYRGTTALPGEYPRLLEALMASGKPVLLIALGNPYLLRGFPSVNAYLAAFSTVPPSEEAAAHAIFGEIPIGGRLPVSIPGLAKLGDGIAVPARTPALQSSAPSMP